MVHVLRGRSALLVLLAAVTVTRVASAANPATPTEDGGAVPYAVQRELVELLRTERFAELDRRLRAYQERYEAGDGDELEVAQAFWSFATSELGLEPHLDAYVASTPGWPSYLARAEWRLQRAELERGTATVRKTGEAQFRELKRWLVLASEDAQRAMRDGPAVQEAYALEIQGLRHGSRGAESERVLARALAADPAGLLARRAHLGSLLPRWGGSMAEMEAFVAAAEAQADKNPRLRLLRNRIHRERADALWRAGQTAAALTEHTRAVSLGPATSALYERAELLVAMGRPGDALFDLNRALTLTPGYANAYEMRARAHAALGRKDRALDDLDRAITLDPLDPPSRRQRGILRIELSDWTGAEDDLRIATRYAPGDAGAWLQLGWVQAYRTRKIVDGAEAIDRALALSPDWDEARRLHADVQKYLPAAAKRRAPTAPPASPAP